MRSLPKIVIVGRPNVGKSSLFNRILGRRAAVVSDREGVTRDRHFQDVSWDSRRFTLVDTGGYLPDEGIDPLADQVRLQISAAVEEAAVVLFLVDGIVGLTELDMRFAKVLRGSSRPVVLVVNKSENPETRLESWEFLKLGFGDPVMVSAITGFEVGNLLSRVLEMVPAEAWDVRGDDEGPREDSDAIRVAILGRPNAGKSTLVNRLTGEDRTVVSDIPGTTRDSIDCSLKWRGRTFVLTDTAGLRKKAKISDDVEYFSSMRSLESIRRSQVCVVMVDATAGIGEQDLRIIRQVIANDRGLIVLFNKWDIVEKGDKTWDHMARELHEKYVELEDMPLFSVSALTGQRVSRLLETIVKVRENSLRVLGREALVEVFERAVAENAHPDRHSKPVLMRRACQILIDPVVVAVECTQPELVDDHWERYFVRRLRQRFELTGAPVKLNFDREIRLRRDDDFGPDAVLPEVPEGAPEPGEAPERADEESDE